MRVAGSHPRSAAAFATAALFTALAIAACGGGPDPSPAPPPTDDGGDGPAPDGGGEPAPGGGGAPPAGGGGGGSGGGGGGTPGDACAGIAPTFGDAVEVQLDTGTHRSCSVATASASGQVALGVRGSFGGPSGTVFVLPAADGSTSTDTIDGFLQNPSFTDDVDPWFHPTSRGWHGIVHPGNGASPIPFRAWDARGAVIAETDGIAVSSAPDRNGGSLLLERTFDPSNATTPTGPTRLEWIDASGRITRAVTLDRNPLLVLSSWATGHAVVVVPGSPGSARWFDESGSALTPWFDAGNVSEQGSSMHLLVDGTVAIRTDGQWQVALRDGAASPGTIPGWLASRPATRLATIRGGRAYAVLPAGSSSDPARFEIVTASGQSCGTVSVPPAPLQPGETRSPGRLDVGYDGTLIQESGRNLTPPGFGIHCAFRWWARLLQ